MFRIMTICLGNVCRSPLAEHLLRDRLPDSFEVGSAGLIGLVGHPMESHAADQLQRLGGTAEDFRARRLDEQMLRGVDLVLAATVEVRGQTVALAPWTMPKTFTLLEFARLAEASPAELVTPAEVVTWAKENRTSAAQAELDVPDPMGRSVEVHRKVADLIDEATRSIADRFSHCTV